MSKADFYKEFQNVIKIKSYREMGWYSYVKTPKRAMRFLTEPSVYSDLKIVKPKPVKVDFVGDALREQMKNSDKCGIVRQIILMCRKMC